LGGSLKAARLGARRGGARRSPEGHAVVREGFGDGFSVAKHIPRESGKFITKSLRASQSDAWQSRISHHATAACSQSGLASRHIKSYSVYRGE